MSSFCKYWRRFGRFNFVGLMGAVWQVGLLWMLTKGMRVPVMAATLTAVEVAVLHNFFWHERFTWREERFRTMRERGSALWRFHVGNGCVSLVGNALLVYALVERLGVPVIAAGALAIGACSVVNFLIAERWVFFREPSR